MNYKSLIITLYFIFFPFIACKASSISVNGIISTNTTWNSDIVYITGDVTVAAGVYLTINPGTSIQFKGSYSLNINGILIANGQRDKMITFSGFEMNTWRGIHFNNPSLSDSSRIYFAIIEKINNTVDGSQDTFTGGGINVKDYSNLIISNCIISNNVLAYYTGAINLVNANPILMQNQISDNTGIGIYCRYQSHPIIKNNTIVKNNGYNEGGGISCEIGSYPMITHCIIRDNDNFQVNGDLEIEFCNIQGGWMWGGQGNFDLDPLFIDPQNGNYKVSWTDFSNVETKSPCIDAGDKYEKHDPDGSIKDVGAYYFHQADKDFPPKSNFKTNETRGESPFIIQFSNLSNAGTGIIQRYEWDFGDGRTSTDLNPFHTYNSNGIYTVKLKSIDANGRSDEEIKIAYIKVGTKINTSIVEGVWTKENGPFLVFNSIEIPKEKQLLIEGGVEVEMQGQFEFNIKGHLIAKGTNTEKIDFIPKDTAEFIYNGGNQLFKYNVGWGGLNFLESDSSLLEFCTIRNVGEGSNNNPKYQKYSNQNNRIGNIIIYNSTNIYFKNCLIKNNFSICPPNSQGAPSLTYGLTGGAGINSYYSTVSIENCTITKNRNIQRAMIGHLHFKKSKGKIKSNIIINNKESNGIGEQYGGRAVVIRGSKVLLIDNKIAGHGVGIYCATDCCEGEPSVQDESTIFQNEIYNNRLGIETYTSGVNYIANNYIHHNVGAAYGSGIYVQSPATIVNNIIAFNENSMNVSGGGGGIYGSGKLIANNTIYGNKASNLGGGGIYASYSNPLIKNNIVWNNTPNQISYFSNNLVSPPVIVNNSINNNTFSGNFSIDPMFADAEHDNFQLLKESFCIDKGSADTTGLNLPEFDIYGSPRINYVKKIVDLGAVEYNDSNNAPTDITLSNANIQTYLPIATVVGEITPTDIDQADTHSFSLVNGTGSDNNNLFNISGNNLQTSSILTIDSPVELKIRIRVTDSKGWWYEKEFVINVELITSLPEESPNSISIYPNPANNVLYVVTDGSHKYKAKIFSTTGLELVGEDIKEGKSEINIETLTNGVYLIKFSNEKGYLVKKIIVSKLD